MTTQIKLASTLPKDAVADLLAAQMWENLGGHYVGIVELKVATRTEPADDDDSSPSAQLKVQHVEFAAGPEDDEKLRMALLARFRARRAIGTLDEAAEEGRAEDPDDLTSPLSAMHELVTKLGQVNGLKADATWAADGTLQINFHETTRDAA